MDVEKAYSMFCLHIANGEYEEAAEYYDSWANWCRKGGFLPQDIADMVRYLSPVLDDGGEGEIQFRIYLRPANFDRWTANCHGNIELCVGDPCWDDDHRGFCGAGSVDESAAPIHRLAALLSAFDEAFDSAFQSA